MLKAIIMMTILLAFITSNALSQSTNPPGATVVTVVTVNNIPITEADVDLEIKRIVLQAKAMQKPIDESMMGAMKEKVIDSLISRELLFQQSKAQRHYHGCGGN